MENKKVEALYIHIPFCHQLCHYCDFAKLYVNDDMVKRYMEALWLELELKMQTDMLFTSVYIGGGTPSILAPTYIQTLFAKLQGHIASGAEITFEMNPEDVTAEYVQMLSQCGVNRISLGVQSFSDELIQNVGRNHTAQKSVEAIQILKASAIENITVDLMFALPGQTIQDVEQDLLTLKQLDLPHISLYSLILEARTRLYMQQDRYDFVDEDIEAEMYTYIRRYLSECGYRQYEISNFAKDEIFESQHNLAYWHQKQYLGLGLGAHEFINQMRRANTKSINTYITQLQNHELPIYEKEHLTPKQQLEEFCFLAFRDCVRGLRLDLLQLAHPKEYTLFASEIASILCRLEKEKLIEQYEPHSYRLTEKGQMFANDVFKSFIDIE